MALFPVIYRLTPTVARHDLRNRVCWTHDCIPTINYLCGHLEKKWLKGYDIQDKEQVRAHVISMPNGLPIITQSAQKMQYYNGCEVCVKHYIWQRKPPIKVKLAYVSARLLMAVAHYSGQSLLVSNAAFWKNS